MSAVMVTRPGKPGEQLVQSLQEKGIACWHIPTLDIKAEDILLPVEDFQQAIFVSPNAVKYSVEKSQSLKDMLPDELIAVGQGTANCLHQAGFQEVIIPAEFNSEGLLKLPQLQAIKGQQILIVKGRGGRALLGEKLTERGAICHYLEAYCRVTARINDSSWQAFLACSELNIVTIASIDAMKALNSNLGSDFNYERLTLVVASQRIKESALLYGYKQIVVAESASNDAMIAAITDFLESDYSESKE